MCDYRSAVGDVNIMLTSKEAKINRILIAAPKSGSGKTMITCALIRALKIRGLKVGARKCGPDYIDPMFHRKALDVESGNLDPYFTDEEMLKYLLVSGCRDNDMTVIEGVMGYYDGIGGTTVEASTYDVAVKTGTPVILVVDAKGVSVTLSALIKGMLDYRKDNNIAGVILNRTSEGFYERIAKVIREECGIEVFGFMPELRDLDIGSRHLGLMQPDEVEGLDVKLDMLAGQIERTVDIDGIIRTAKGAPELSEVRPAELDGLPGSVDALKVRETKPVIAVARDEAFGFFYDDNIRLLMELGAEPVYFSPLHDAALPEGTDGIILYGGYPEEHAAELEGNVSMKRSILEAYKKGIPIIAECGGFMYLQKELETKDGHIYEMCGVIPGRAFFANRLVRFGYMEAKAQKPGLYGDKGLVFRGHEFHYWDCSINGNDFKAVKPGSVVSYECMIHESAMAAGFAHIYAYGNPKMYLEFLKKAVG